MRTQGPVPRHPTHLVNSHWTCVMPEGIAHYTVASFAERGVVVLEPLLPRYVTHVIPWRDLRDRDRWRPGWSALGSTPDDA